MKRIFSIIIAIVLFGSACAYASPCCETECAREIMQDCIQAPSGASGAEYSATLDESGSILSVKLRANPTTGYTWHYASSPAIWIHELADTYVVDDAADGAVGVAGWEEFTFETTLEGAGWCVLQFAYSREWDEETPPAATCNVYLWIAENGQIEISDVVYKGEAVPE